jgi:hypothetical protein
MDAAAHKLRMIILNPAIILTWVMGLALFGRLSYPSDSPGSGPKSCCSDPVRLHGYLIGLGKRSQPASDRPKRLRMLW